MPVTIACPNCDARLEAPDDIVGKKVQCKKCGEKFRARPVDVEDADDGSTRRAARSASKSRSRPADEEDEDERPSRRAGKASRRRDEDDADDRDEDEGKPRRRPADEDDAEGEPRARKKKGKRKKARSPVVMWSLIGIGVLILIAGIGAYFSSSGDNADNSGPTGGPVSSAGGPGGEAAGDPNVPGWVEFADPGGQFKVRMPRAPAAPTKQQWPLPSGEQGEATIYSIEIGGGLYAVAYLTIPGREPGAPADPVLDETIDTGVGWFKGAVIKSRVQINHQGFRGRQAVLEYPGVKGSTIVRVILAGTRMFWVVAKGENIAVDTPKVRGFFDSFKIN